MRTAYAAIFSRGVPLHDLSLGKVHKLDAAIAKTRKPSWRKLSAGSTMLRLALKGL